MVKAQGGDPRVVEDPSRLPRARHQVEVPAAADGFVTATDALALGLTAVALGAGRTRADQQVDPAVGIELCAKPGTRGERGQPLARLHLSSKKNAAALVARAAAAFSVGKRPPASRPLVLERIAK